MALHALTRNHVLCNCWSHLLIPPAFSAPVWLFGLSLGRTLTFFGLELLDEGVVVRLRGSSHPVQSLFLHRLRRLTLVTLLTVG